MVKCVICGEKVPNDEGRTVVGLVLEERFCVVRKICLDCLKGGVKMTLDPYEARKRAAEVDSR